MQLTFATLVRKGAVDVEKRSVDTVLSSDTIDGHGEIIDQATLRLERYRKNPVILWMHDPLEPIGRAENVRVEDGKLQARIVFARTSRGHQALTLFADGALNAFSVGGRPGRVVHEVRHGANVPVLYDFELYEASAVSIPSNPEAVVRHKSLGLVPASFELSAGGVLVAMANKAVFGEPLPELPTTGNASQDLANLATRNASVLRAGSRDEVSSLIDNLFPEVG